MEEGGEEQRAERAKGADLKFMNKKEDMNRNEK